MATISTSLRMFDQMTQPLMRTTNALNTTSISMDKMANSANQNIKMESSLNNIYKATEKTNTILTELSNSQNNATNGQNRLNDSFDRGSSSAGGLINKIKGLVGTYLGFQVAKKGIEATIGGAMGLQQQLFTIQGIMGNKDVGEAYFNNLQKKANESVFAFEDFANNARKFMQFTKNTKSLDKLANLSERLTLMDPTQGLEGAGFALKEIMSGDGVSLKERFGFGKAEIEILKASRGMDDFISKFDKLLNKKGFTEGMLQQYNASAAAQFDNLKSNFKTSLSEAGNGALEILAPVITKINQTFSSGGFEGFFNGISNGLAIIVNISLKVVDVFQWIGNTVSSNWGIISPIIWGIIAALIVYNLVSFLTNSIIGTQAILKSIQAASTMLATGATFAETAAQYGLNAALLACPLTWIILAIIALIVVFYAAIGVINKLAGTSISATGVICGAFMSACAFIGNLIVTLANMGIDIIGLIWNQVAGFAEFFANVFNDPVGSIVRLFSSMADTVLGILEGIASAIDTIFGSNLASAVGGWRTSLDGAVKGLVGEGQVKVPRMDTSAMHLKRFDYGNAYNSGYKFGEKVEDKFDIGNLFKGLDSKLPKDTKLPNLDAWNKTQGPGNLSNGVGGLDKGLKDANKNLKNINDKIDISNEHLEMLRDLAEEKSISNFTTLTPTVNIQTGDIREEADINKIITKIETYMENELLNSTEGVYA